MLGLQACITTAAQVNLFCDRRVQKEPWAHGGRYFANRSPLGEVSSGGQAGPRQSFSRVPTPPSSSSHTESEAKDKDSPGDHLVRTRIFSVSPLKGPPLSLEGGTKHACSLTLRRGEGIGNDCNATGWQVTVRLRKGGDHGHAMTRPFACSLLPAPACFQVVPTQGNCRAQRG